jgi:hypothetical protein
LLGKRKSNFDRGCAPYWGEFSQTLIRLVHAWSECSSTARVQSPPIKSQVFLDRLAPNRKQLAIYADLLFDMTGDALLTVAPGQKVPRSGVWEWIGSSDIASSRADLFYLAAESKAPVVGPSPTDGAIHHWRLFWEDVRYKDGILPLEEFAYFPRT